MTISRIGIVPGTDGLPVTMALPAALRGNGFPSQTGDAGGRR